MSSARSQIPRERCRQTAPPAGAGAHRLSPGPSSRGPGSNQAGLVSRVHSARSTYGPARATRRRSTQVPGARIDSLSLPAVAAIRLPLSRAAKEGPQPPVGCCSSWFGGGSLGGGPQPSWASLTWTASSSFRWSLPWPSLAGAGRSLAGTWVCSAASLTPLSAALQGNRAAGPTPSREPAIPYALSP